MNEINSNKTLSIWTQEEEHFLMKAVEKYGAGAW